LGYAQFSGRSPRIFTVWNGSAERFRTSDGIAELITYDFLGKASTSLCQIIFPGRLFPFETLIVAVMWQGSVLKLILHLD
jgi:hypothetical protein